MATADIDRMFFCHNCRTEVSSTEDITCSNCHSGAIEELSNHSDTSVERDDTADTFTHIARARTSGTRTHHGPFFGSTPHSQFVVSFGGGGGGVGGGGGGMRGSHNEFDALFQQILESNVFFRGALNQQAQSNGFQLGSSFGDYVWGPNGFDDVITQLLNQLDNSGPPPADKSKIDALPIHEIQQKEIDVNTDCAVCQELFVLSEKVKKLPCEHKFHPPCIEPWLKLHDSCPICRCNLNGERSRDET